MNRLVNVLTITILLVALTTSACGNESTLQSNNGADTVTVYRDGFGVPHIYADTPEAAIYALGYVQAQDHLEQMRLNYLTAAGRLAEFGLGDPNRDNDMYRLHIPQTAHATYEVLVPEHRSRLEAFVNGINRYVVEQSQSLPDWVTLVKPYEVLAFSQYKAITEQSRIALTEMNAGKDDRGGTDASNMWVVAPSRSTLGAAILVGDPHLPWSGTDQWYEVHLNYPGVNIAGVLRFGSPTISIGANDNFAWSATNNAADTADIYAETVNPDNPNQYLRDGIWVDLKAETVTIKEKVGDEIIDHTFTNYYSVHGPLIGSESGTYYAAAMVTFDLVVDRIGGFDTAELTAIPLESDSSQVPVFHKWNLIMADRNGNIGYIWNARIARRSELIDWSRPVDGSTSVNDWGPFHTQYELPQTTNPTWGYLQNANNSAWTTASNLNPNDYPNYMGGSGFGDRAIRAQEMLDSRPQHSLEDMLSMAFDSLSVRARYLIPIALDVWEEVRPSVPDPNGTLQAAIELLAKWDFMQDKENREPAVARLFIDTFYKAVPHFSATNVPPAEQWSQSDKYKMVTALQQATDRILTDIGQLDPLWGDVHKIQRGEQLFGTGGGNKELPSLYMANANLFEDGIWWAGSGSSYIFVIAFTEPLTFYSIRPLGQSEDPSSTHFANQTQLFANKQFKRVWMTLADVQAHAESSFIMEYA